MIISIALASALTLQTHGDVVLLPASDGPGAALRHVAAQCSRSRGIVLFIHGATFPSALSFAYPIDGKSWMSELADAGFDAWALDFVGYGRADRDARMRDEASAHAPLGRAKDALPQIEEAVAHIRRNHPGRRVSIVAHSWGTVPAAMYVIAHPELVDRFVLYGPIVARSEAAESMTNAWFLSNAEQQWHSFLAGVPAGRTPAIDRAAFDVWMESYLASDPSPGLTGVKVPAGPIADLNDMLAGNVLYDPAAIAVPTLILRGEWDAVTTATDAAALFAKLTGAPLKRMVWISEGTHRMHLERSRRQVYREVQTFLEGEN